MSFAQSNLPVQVFANRYGKIDRTFGPIAFFRDASDRNTSIDLTNSTFLARDGQGGKLREVHIVYFPVSCDATAQCGQNICDTGTALEPKVQRYTISQCIESELYSLNADAIRQVDFQRWDFNESAMNMIMSKMPAFRREIAKSFVARAHALAGTHADGNQTHKIVNLSLAEGRPNALALTKVSQEYADLGLDMPMILGGGDFYALKQLVGIGGVNDNGVNIGEMAGVSGVYYDDAIIGQVLNDLANGNWGFTVSPDTFKMITYSKNAGIWRTQLTSPEDIGELRFRSMGGAIHGTIFDAATGLLYDFDAIYDTCTSTWKWLWRFEYDFLILPNIVCNDTVGEVNGLMEWRTCPQVEQECPTGQSPSIPAATTTYSWTPSGGNYTALEGLFGATIDGYVSTPNNTGTSVDVGDIDSLLEYMNNNSNTKFTKNGSAIEFTSTSNIAASFITTGGVVTANFA